MGTILGTVRKGRSQIGSGLILIILCLPLLACGFPAWRDQVLREIAEQRWQVNPAQVGSAGMPSRSLDFYGPDGRRLGYGRIQGGTIDDYNPDGSRAGSGSLRH